MTLNSASDLFFRKTFILKRGKALSTYLCICLFIYVLASIYLFQCIKLTRLRTLLTPLPEMQDNTLQNTLKIDPP